MADPFLLRTARFVLFLIELGATAGVSLWCLGRLLSDRFGWSQWLLWIPTPVALGLAFVGVLAAGRPDRPRRPRHAIRTRRRRVGVWLAVAAVTTAHYLFVEHRLPSRQTPSPPGLSVMHWNMTAKRATPLADLAAVVVTQDADVTILTNSGPIRAEPTIREWSMDRVHRRRSPFTVITKFPIERFRELVDSDDIHVTLLELDTSEVASRSLVLWLVDLPSEPGRSRMAVSRRTRQLIADAGAPTPDLIVGDLNMTRGSASLRHLAPGHRHAFALAGRGYGATYPRRRAMYHIDHILVGPGLSVADYRIVDPGIGEHRLQRAVMNDW